MAKYPNLGREIFYYGSMSLILMPSEAGEYVVFLLRQMTFLQRNVAGVVNNSVGRAEFTIYKNEGSASKEIKAEHAGAVPPQNIREGKLSRRLTSLLTA